MLRNFFCNFRREREREKRERERTTGMKRRKLVKVNQRVKISEDDKKKGIKLENWRWWWWERFWIRRKKIPFPSLPLKRMEMKRGKEIGERERGRMERMQMTFGQVEESRFRRERSRSIIIYGTEMLSLLLLLFLPSSSFLLPLSFPFFSPPSWISPLPSLHSVFPSFPLSLEAISLFISNCCDGCAMILLAPAIQHSSSSLSLPS